MSVHAKPSIYCTIFIVTGKTIARFHLISLLFLYVGSIYEVFLSSKINKSVWSHACFANLFAEPNKWGRWRGNPFVLDACLLLTAYPA